MCAADLGTIRPHRFPGADTLDEHGGPDLFQARVISDQSPIQFKVRDYPRIRSVQVLFGPGLICPGSDYCDPVFDLLLPPSGDERCPEVPDKTFHIPQFRFKMDLDMGV